MNIKVKINNTWLPANEEQINQYNNIIRIGDEYHGGIYLINDPTINEQLTEQTTEQIPIADWDNVKVFLLDQTPVNWYSARNYQTWAYFDFIYSNEHTRHYKSKETVNHENHIEIPIDNIYPNIIFSLSRNENGTIFYEKNDIERTRVRISNNENARQGYYGYYQRMTVNIFPTYVTNNNVTNNNILELPSNIPIIKTLDDELMCIVCCDIQQNIKFIPCNHTSMCSECYKNYNKKKECIICRGKINNICII